MIFSQRLGPLDEADTKKAIRTVANYVRALQEQLEYTLTTLDSDNVIEIDTAKTTVSSSDGGAATGDGVLIKGRKCAAFSVKREAGGSLTMRMTAEDGRDIIFASSSAGEIELRMRTPFFIDCGSWDA